jgi:hypothetical protein
VKHHSRPSEATHRPFNEASVASPRARGLEPDLKNTLEPRFGHRLDAVRVHADDESARLAQALEAKAFTFGQDIFFGDGWYQPHLERGQRLIAHEVAHTIQQAQTPQSTATDPVSLGVTRPGDAVELEATRAADAVVAGGSATLTPSSAPIIAREPTAEPNTEATKSAVIAGNMPWMTAFNPNWVWALTGQGLTGTNSDGTTTRTQHADVSLLNGFGFNLGERRLTQTDEDHAFGSHYGFGLNDGRVGVDWGSHGQSLAEDGTKIADANSGKLTLSTSGFGLESASSSTRDTVTTSRASQVFWDDGKWGMSHGRDRSFRLDDDHQLSSGTKASLGSEGVSLSRETQSRIRDAETSAVEADAKNFSVGWGKDGFSAARRSSQTTEVDGQKFTTATQTGFSGGNVTRTNTRQHTSTDADGNEVTTAQSTGYSVGRDGVGFNASSTDAKGNKTAGSLSADAGLDENGHLNRVQLGGGISRNNKSVSVNAGYQVTASDPRALEGPMRGGTRWIGSAR